MSTDLSPGDPTHHQLLAEALREEFLAGKAGVPETHDAYSRDLRNWLDFCAARGIDPLHAWPTHVQRWLSELTKGDPAIGRKPEAGTTRARRLGAVSSWYSWLIRHEAAPRNPAMLERAERPTRAPKKAAALSVEHAKLLVAAAATDTPRAALIVALLIYTGLRAAELCGANLSDLRMVNGELVLHVRGKGGKTRDVRINSYVAERLNAYQESRPDVDNRPVTTDQAGAGQVVPLIGTYRGKRLDRKAIRELLTRLADKAGLPKLVIAGMTPHGTRATYATQAIASGQDLRAVQQTMGHARPETTAGYDRSLVTAERDPAIQLLGVIHAPEPDIGA